jgi:LacI family transcriptional regulator
MKPHVLLVFSLRFEESTAMLKGVAHYARLHHPWAFFLDGEARAATDGAWLRDQKWDGVISRHTTPALTGICAQLKIPLVDLNDTASFAGIPKIRPDNTAIGRLGAAHFMERGFRTLGFNGYENEVWSRERRDGFAEATRLAGKKCEVLDVEYPDDPTPAWEARQTAAISQWLRHMPRPAAVMACCDMQAQLVITAAREAGLHVPEEVAVLGVNNDPLRCDLGTPPLSSVATNAFQSGYLAAECLAGLMDGLQPEAGDVRVAPAGVVCRQSTDTFAINDRIVAAAIHYIREHACHGLTVGQVLRQVYTSRSVLEKKFRAHLKCSPQTEIRRVQVAKISQLLQETDFPLKKIAGLTGFEHVEYLCVVFKRLMGLAPGAYRKQHRQKAGGENGEGQAVEMAGEAPRRRRRDAR